MMRNCGLLFSVVNDLTLQSPDCLNYDFQDFFCCAEKYMKCEKRDLCDSRCVLHVTLCIFLVSQSSFYLVNPENLNKITVQTKKNAIFVHYKQKTTE